MWRQFKNPKCYLIVAADGMLFSTALLLAFLLRLEFSLPPLYAQQVTTLLPMTVAIKVGVFFALGAYRGMWRYTSLKDIVTLLYATCLSTLLIVSWLVFRQRFEDYSRAIILLDGVLTFLLTAGLRAAIRNAGPVPPQVRTRIARNIVWEGAPEWLGYHMTKDKSAWVIGDNLTGTDPLFGEHFEARYRELRRQIALVLQEPFLFPLSIAENISYGRPDATDEEVEEAARAAEADGFIRGLAEGYDTLVGQRGVNLSGGQKQRIAIARALLVRPALLIMDDSTSAVDVRTEARIRQNLAASAGGQSRLIVA
ncbi:MAG: ATP-binding cassette domain-containing protein, partial [bacterium]